MTGGLPAEPLVHVGEHRCPYCDSPNNAVSFAGEADVDGLGDGDLLVCWSCRRPCRARMSPLGVVTVEALTPEEQRRALVGLRDVLSAMDVARSPLEAAAYARRRG